LCRSTAQIGLASCRDFVSLPPCKFLAVSLGLARSSVA